MIKLRYKGESFMYNTKLNIWEENGKNNYEPRDRAEDARTAKTCRKLQTLPYIEGKNEEYKII